MINSGKWRGGSGRTGANYRIELSEAILDKQLYIEQFEYKPIPIPSKSDTYYQHFSKMTRHSVAEWVEEENREICHEHLQWYGWNLLNSLIQGEIDFDKAYIDQYPGYPDVIGYRDGLLVECGDTEAYKLLSLNSFGGYDPKKNRIFSMLIMFPFGKHLMVNLLFIRLVDGMTK